MPKRLIELTTKESIRKEQEKKECAAWDYGIVGE